MLVEQKSINLKDGRIAVIRNATDADIDSMLEYLRVSAGETEFIMRYPEECDRYTVEGERRFFSSVNASASDCMLLCDIDGEIAGSANISWSTYTKVRHRANIAIALTSKFWGLGIGTQMLKELLEIATNDPFITQVELDFVEGNSRARALYEKLGFRITGIKPNAIRLKDGTLLNEYSMVLMLEK